MVATGASRERDRVLTAVKHICALRKCPSGSTVGCDPIIKPARGHVRISRTSVGGAPVEAYQFRGMARIARDQPRRFPSIGLGVVLPQPPVGPPPI